MEFTNELYHLNRSVVPEEVILKWDDFVCKLKEGYTDNVEDYDYDLNAIRANIGPLLNSKELHKFTEHKIFCKAIEKIDTKFKELTYEVNFDAPYLKWWEKRLLKKAGRDYADFVNESWGEQFGFVVERISR